MRKVQVNANISGAELAKSVFTPQGTLLFAAGVKLRDSYVKRIAESGIGEIYIEDEASNDISIGDADHDQTYRQAEQLVDNLMESYTFTSSKNIGKAKKAIVSIIRDILSDKGIIANLYNLKSVDDYTFEHSINVSVFSLVMGIGLGYNALRLKDLGIGALLHDIGKMRIPEEILKKPYKLTVEEFEEIKKHTVYGYDILKNNRNISAISSFIAIGHHERYDGSGYPLQIKGENIHQCARIVAVADVFDALSSDRVYRKKMKPCEVFEYIASLGSQHFDQEIVDSFMSYICIYPVGSGVVLNTRERGLVMDINKRTPTKPVVKIIYNEKGEKLKRYQLIDLTQKEDVLIEGLCDI